MTQIVLTEASIIRLLDSCDFPGVTVQSCPHEWDAGYVTRLLDATPAILVAFLGADDPADSTELNLMSRWSAYICVGWNGKGQEARRLGAGAGFDLMHRTAAALHDAILMEENGERLSSSQVEGIAVETDSSLDVTGLWIGSIAIKIGLPLPLLEGDACYGPLDNFLSVRATIDLPGGEPLPDIENAGTDGDVPLIVDLPQ